MAGMTGPRCTSEQDIRFTFPAFVLRHINAIQSSTEQKQRYGGTKVTGLQQRREHSSCSLEYVLHLSGIEDELSVAHKHLEATGPGRAQLAQETIAAGLDFRSEVA